MATLKQLHIFIAVAETLQMSEAARRLYLSQPTVSQTIAELEKEFDAALFERTPKLLKLTAKGAIFWEYAQQLPEYAGQYAAMQEKHAQYKRRRAADKAKATRQKNRRKAETRKDEEHEN